MLSFNPMMFRERTMGLYVIQCNFISFCCYYCIILYNNIVSEFAVCESRFNDVEIIY